MKYQSKVVLTAALASLVSLAANAQSKAAPDEGKASGKCYGVVGAGEGECGGKDPATGKGWGCAGSNPTADLGWKQMSKKDCDAAPKHKDAKKKSFVADKS